MDEDENNEIEQVEHESSESEETPTSPETPSGKLTPKPEPRVLTIPSKAMAEIKAKERERGRKMVFAELDKDARALGYKSHDDMKRAAQRAKKGLAKRPVEDHASARQRDTSDGDEGRTAVQTQHPRYLKKLERERERAVEQARIANKARVQEERRRKQLEKQLASKDAEAELRMAAVRAGVQDVDYGLTLLRRKLSKLTPKELESFNEDDFFSSELREKHPYLYGVSERPANTGSPGEGVPPKAPGGPAIKEKHGENGAIDARKLTPDAYRDLLRKKGLADPSLS